MKENVLNEFMLKFTDFIYVEGPNVLQDDFATAKYVNTPRRYIVRNYRVKLEWPQVPFERAVTFAYRGIQYAPRLIHLAVFAYNVVDDRTAINIGHVTEYRIYGYPLFVGKIDTPKGSVLFQSTWQETSIVEVGTERDPDIVDTRAAYHYMWPTNEPFEPIQLAEAMLLFERYNDIRVLVPADGTYDDCEIISIPKRG